MSYYEIISMRLFGFLFTPAGLTQVKWHDAPSRYHLVSRLHACITWPMSPVGLMVGQVEITCSVVVALPTAQSRISCL